MKEFILLKLQYKLSLIVFLSLAPSALISWPERGTSEKSILIIGDINFGAIIDL